MDVLYGEPARRGPLRESRGWSVPNIHWACLLGVCNCGPKHTWRTALCGNRGAKSETVVQRRSCEAVGSELATLWRKRRAGNLCGEQFLAQRGESTPPMS